MANILLIDDDEDLTEYLREELTADRHKVECLDRAERGPDRLAAGGIHVVLLDNKMPGMTGLDFLEELRRRKIEVPVILMTGYASSDTAIKATRLRAFDYVIKPHDFQSLVAELRPIIKRALEFTRPPEVHVPGTEKSAPDSLVLVGRSRPMREVYRQIGDFADERHPVLIRGDTGTGKELVARAFHTNSSRSNKPFVALNCSAINENLLESELFGHEPGAFTGAAKLRKGKIEYASGGTLFLDEIGDMPQHLQAKLLRVLEYQMVERLGSNEPVKVDVRLLSATHQDLEAMIEEGKFRRDLYFRLNRVVLRLPPLRDRLDDLPELVDYFVCREADASGRTAPVVAAETLEQLRAHPWPGNIRELQNVVSAAFVRCQGSQLLAEHLKFANHGPDNHPASGEAGARCALQKAIAWAFDTNQEKLWPLLRDMLEEELLKVALQRFDGNHTEIAKRLDMARGTVIKRLEEYALK